MFLHSIFYFLFVFFFFAFCLRLWRSTDARSSFRSARRCRQGRSSYPAHLECTNISHVCVEIWQYMYTSTFEQTFTPGRGQTCTIETKIRVWRQTLFMFFLFQRKIVFPNENLRFNFFPCTNIIYAPFLSSLYKCRFSPFFSFITIIPIRIYSTTRQEFVVTECRQFRYTRKGHFRYIYLYFKSKLFKGFPSTVRLNIWFLFF